MQNKWHRGSYAYDTVLNQSANQQPENVPEEPAPLHEQRIENTDGVLRQRAILEYFSQNHRQEWLQSFSLSTVEIERLYQHHNLTTWTAEQESKTGYCTLGGNVWLDENQRQRRPDLRNTIYIARKRAMKEFFTYYEPFEWIIIQRDFFN